MASIEFPKQEPTIEFPTSTGTSTPAPKPQAKGYHNQDPPGRIKNAYGRQALAGVADIVTQIPTLLGLAGTGIETAGRYIATDDDLSTSLDKSMASGFDKDLMALGKQGFDATNEVLNIPSPKTPGEVLSRLATLIVPNPSSVGRVGTALNLLTPFVKVVPKAGPTVANALRNKGNLGSLKSMLTAPGQYATKGNVARMGIQLC